MGSSAQSEFGTSPASCGNLKISERGTKMKEVKVGIVGYGFAKPHPSLTDNRKEVCVADFRNDNLNTDSWHARPF